MAFALVDESPPPPTGVGVAGLQQHDPAPGPVLANYGVDNLRFLTPVYPGDTLGVRLTCKEINPRVNAEHGEVRWDCQVTKQDGALVAQYDVLTMVAKTWPLGG